MRLTLGGQGPIAAMSRMLEHADLDGFFLMVAHLDLEALRRDAIGTIFG